MNNYIKIISKRPSIFLERSAEFGHLESSRELFELFFFDDSDPDSVSGAEQRRRAFLARQPAASKNQVSIYRPCSHFDRVPTIGESPCEREMRRTA